jgi:predicted transcriptional regulator
MANTVTMEIITTQVRELVSTFTVFENGNYDFLGQNAFLRKADGA